MSSEKIRVSTVKVTVFLEFVWEAYCLNDMPDIETRTALSVEKLLAICIIPYTQLKNSAERCIRVSMQMTLQSRRRTQSRHKTLASSADLPVRF